jgi:hypothetical protein
VIDFRYHLVSIVSIFLALAVGIVLGAGPLQQGISTTVSTELGQLRQDKSDLRAQLDAETRAAQARDAFVAAANPTLVADALAGRTVSLVVLPGADSAVTKATATILEVAGATVTSTTTIHQAWVATDAQTAEARRQVADDIATQLGTDSATADGSMVDAALAQLLVHPPTTVPGGLAAGADPAVVTKAVADLTKADLLAVDVAAPVPADLAVVIAPDAQQGASDADKAAADAYVTLVKALDVGGSGAVLASNVGVSGAQDAVSIVTELRRDAEAVKVVSTVDDIGLPMGRASVVFALTQQLDGQAGQYGLRSGVTAAFPPLPSQTAP